MRQIRILSSGVIIILVAFLTVLFSSFLLLVLSQMGVIAFTGGGWLVHSFNMITAYLGPSILFFMPVLLGYCIFFVLLRRSLREDHSATEQAEDIRFYNGGTDIFITLFFAIGVLFTAWGLQNALVSALGDVNRSEAARLGAWGILKRLVDNGILIALWTTIVGGAGGYLMRLAKYIFLGRQLNRYAVRGQAEEKRSFFDALESIRAHVEKIERSVSNTG